MQEYVVNVWKVRKQNCMGMTHALESQASPGGLGDTAGVKGQRLHVGALCLLQSDHWYM